MLRSLGKPEALRACVLGVLLVLLSHVAAAQNIDMGTGYRSLQMLASSLEVQFENGCKATTTREGTRFITVAKRPAGAGSDDVRLAFEPQTGRLVVFGRENRRAEEAIPDGLSPEIDWLNVVACAIAEQRATIPSSSDELDLLWAENLLQIRGAQRRTLREASVGISSMTAEFPQHRVVTQAQRSPERPQVLPMGGEYSWESTVFDRRTSAVHGRVRWFPAERVLAFSFPKYREPAVITEKNLGKPFPFEANIAWGTMQAFAFQHSLEQRERALLGRTPPGVVAASVNPRLRLTQGGDGCTGLWWLNGSLFRACCDLHDYCYEMGSCDMYSWFAWTMAYPFWTCTVCNLAVVTCFADTLCIYMGMGIPCMFF